MEMKVTNRSDRQVLLRLRSGMTRTLAPGDVVEKLEAVEVLGNARIDHLVAGGFVSIEAVEGKAARSRGGKKPARPKKRSARASSGGSSSSGRRSAATANKPTPES